MADPQHSKPRRLWRVLFALSLALNVAVVGLVAGVGMRDKVGGKSPRGFELSLGPIGQALRPEDRRAIGEALRNSPELRGNGRAEMRAQLAEFVDALTATPFSQERLSEVMANSNSRIALVQEAARNALVTRIAQMTDAERLMLAERVSENSGGRKRR